MGAKKRDTGKIKTNPKYKCLDEGSENDNDPLSRHQKQINDDP